MKKSFEIPWEKSGAKGFAPTQPIALGIERFSDNTYFGLRQAMVATATEGTARKNISTRNISRKFFADLEIGGKTGSLDGTDPQGRYDWFMGFAQSRKNPEKSVVLVVLQVHANAEHKHPRLSLRFSSTTGQRRNKCLTSLGGI